MNAPTVVTDEGEIVVRKPGAQAWAIAAAGALAAVYLAASILIARHRPFWYDEVLTVIYSGQPSLAALWHALARGADGVPPANDLVVRLFASLPLRLEVAARLPSALAMAAGLLVTFDCARRLTDGVHGLVAVAFLTCSTLPYYGYEARPYAMFFLLSVAALWLWMHTAEASTGAAVAFGGTFFAMCWVHYYAALVLLPFTLWEIVNRHSRRVPSRKLIAAYVGVACALGPLWPQIAALHEVLARGFWSPASPRNLAVVFADLFPHVLLPIAGTIGVAALWGPSEERSSVAPMPPYEQLCWFFALLPVAGFVVGKLITHAFLGRYFLPLLPAFAIGLASLLWRHAPDSSRLALIAGALFAVFGLANELEHVQYAASVRPVTATREAERMVDLLGLEAALPPSRFLVLRTGDLLSLETHYYAQHPERVVFLLGAGESAPEPQAAESTGANRPIHYWTVAELRAHAAYATLVDPTPETLEDLHRARHANTEHYDNVLDVVTAQ